MNALFHGIALSNDKEAMKEFLKTANIEGDFTDFEIYSEFSLSDFGNPDMVIIAKYRNNKKEEKEVIFIEAKASCGKKYKIHKQYAEHNEYVKEREYKSGQSSNLFFQLRQKYYFFETKCKKNETDKLKIPDLIKYYDQKKKAERRTGNNPVVKEFMKQISECESAHYVAIIPKSDYSEIKTGKDYGFDIQFVSWEDLNEKFEKYLNKTITFNQSGKYNQIINND